MIYYRVHKDCIIPYDYSSYDIGIYKDYDLMVSDLRQMLDKLADSYDSIEDRLPDGMTMEELFEIDSEQEWYDYDAEDADDCYIGPHKDIIKKLHDSDWFRMDATDRIRVSREQFVPYRLGETIDDYSFRYDKSWRTAELDQILSYLEDSYSALKYAIERKKQRKSLENSDGD